MMIFGLGFDFCSIFKAWRIDVSRHRFLPFLGSFSFRHFYRNDVVRHWCWLDRNDLMRHAERCLRTRHVAGQIIAVSKSGPFDSPIDKAWTRSGTQLQESLKPHVPESLLDRLKTAIDLRNEVAHGFHSEITDTEVYELLGLPVDAIQSGDRITVKREPKKSAAAFKTLTWRGDALKELHKELIAIEGELEKTLCEKINSLL